MCGITESIRDVLVYIKDQIVVVVVVVAVEAANQGGTVGEGTVSGLMFADDFVGKSEAHPKGCRNR